MAIDLELAKLVRKAFWKTYEGLAQFCNTLPAKLTNEEYLEGDYYQRLRMPWGTFRYFIVEDSKYGRQVKINDLVSSHWLGCEGLAMFIAMYNIHQQVIQNPEWDARKVTVVHDEIGCTCLEEYYVTVATLVQNEMYKAMQVWIRDFPAIEIKDPLDLIADCWSEK